jgi:hypothetical protein
MKLTGIEQWVNDVTWILGKGDREFLAPLGLAVGLRISAVTVADPGCR